MARNQSELEYEVLEEQATPPLWKVILLNDDVTPMDFVVLVLSRIFNKTAEQAIEIMLQVHNEGSGICGVYTHEIAETKVDQVSNMAKENKFPLKCIMEEDE